MWWVQDYFRKQKRQTTLFLLHSCLLEHKVLSASGLLGTSEAQQTQVSVKDLIIKAHECIALTTFHSFGEGDGKPPPCVTEKNCLVQYSHGPRLPFSLLVLTVSHQTWLLSFSLTIPHNGKVCRSLSAIWYGPSKIRKIRLRYSSTVVSKMLLIVLLEIKKKLNSSTKLRGKTIYEFPQKPASTAQPRKHSSAHIFHPEGIFLQTLHSQNILNWDHTQRLVHCNRTTGSGVKICIKTLYIPSTFWGRYIS